MEQEKNMFKKHCKKWKQEIKQEILNQNFQEIQKKKKNKKRKKSSKKPKKTEI
jgi:hypothetical protein